jgi:pilus assembly protein Flp/PilA
MNNILAALCTLQARFFATDDERGATATEYALLLAFIAIVIIGAVTLLGGKVSGLFSTAASSI